MVEFGDGFAVLCINKDVVTASVVVHDADLVEVALLVAAQVEVNDAPRLLCQRLAQQLCRGQESQRCFRRDFFAGHGVNVDFLPLAADGKQFDFVDVAAAAVAVQLHIQHAPRIARLHRRKDFSKRLEAPGLHGLARRVLVGGEGGQHGAGGKEEEKSFHGHILTEGV